MRVAWVQDISRPHGGAECSNRTVVAAGEKLGHDIVGITPQNFNPWVLDQADVLIVNNFFQFGRAMFELITRRLWTDGAPYVVYSHDHRDLQARPAFAKKLFGASRLNVFISPRHMGNYVRGLGCEGAALPLAIDVELFRPVPGIERQEGLALIVGGWMRGGKVGKELRAFIQGNGDCRYLSVGLPVPGAELLPKQPLEKMPEVYSRASSLVHFPDMECAGERVVFEAALCGVREFHLGERVGHASWGYDLSDDAGLRKTLREAPVEFWRLVKERCA